MLQILDAYHIRNGKIIWEAHELNNTLHKDGAEFVLRAAMMGGKTNNLYIPDYFFLGLDNRSTISVDDTLSDLEDEPVGSGYARQPVASNGGFSHSVVSGVHRITSDIVTFTATADFGPVSNLFLTDETYLIATILLRTSDTIVEAGDSINLRLGLTARDYPT